MRKMTREEFLKGWTGYILLLTPTAKLENVEESKTSLGRFLPILKPYRRLLLEVFLASLVLQFFGLAPVRGGGKSSPADPARREMKFCATPK
jgi:ATP-binding cassette subfamily B protein